MRTSSTLVVDAFTRSPRCQRPRIDKKRFMDGVRPAGVTLVALSAGVLASLVFGLSMAHGQRLIRYVDGKAPSGTYNEFTRRVVGVGDLDHDGVPDVMAYRYFENVTQKEDTVMVLSGADGHTLFVLSPPPGTYPLSFGYYGAAMDRAGDVDGDGVPDMLFGQPQTDGDFVGAAYVFSGADGSLIRTWYGSGVHDMFGSSVAGLGDVDGDGHSDVAVGSGYWSEVADDVHVYSGAAGSLLATVHSDVLYSDFGRTLALAGDADGDGVPDLAVSDPAEQTVVVISGASIGKGAPQVLWHAEPATPGYSWGRNLDGAGDINGDGHDDLLVSNEQPVVPGEACVLSGADGSVLLTLKGVAQEADFFGRCVAGLGDVNGDGTPDLAVGSWPGTPPSFTSSLPIFSGKDGSILCTIQGDSSAGTFYSEGIGETVSRVGDVDGDGLADIMVGNRNANPNPVDPAPHGRVYVFGIGGSWTWLGHSLMSSIGTSVLIGTGTAHAGLPLDVALSNAPPSAPGLLVVGLTEVMATMKGGTLVPSPDVLVMFATDASGAATWTGTWPDALVSGLQFTLQAWLPDAGSPQGWSASSAIRIQD